MDVILILVAYLYVTVAALQHMLWEEIWQLARLLMQKLRMPPRTGCTLLLSMMVDVSAGLPEKHSRQANHSNTFCQCVNAVSAVYYFIISASSWTIISYLKNLRVCMCLYTAGSSQCIAAFTSSRSFGTSLLFNVKWKSFKAFCQVHLSL